MGSPSCERRNGQARPTPRCPPHRDPEKPAAHVSICLALLPSGPDAVRRLRLHRFRAAVRRAKRCLTQIRGGLPFPSPSLAKFSVGIRIEHLRVLTDAKSLLMTPLA